MATTARRIVMLLAACALAAPAAASAADPEPSTGGTAAPIGEPALIATPNVLEGSLARFRGTFPARAAGRTVTIERFDAGTGAWIPFASALVASDGSYVATWRADVIG